jgi:HSP20 family protein
MPMERDQELAKLRDLFYELFGRTFREFLPDGGLGRAQWSPPVDVYQQGQKFVVEAEISGVDRESIQIEFSGNELTIKGERALPFQEGKASIHRLERQHGRFERQIEMAVPIDSKSITADYEAGVLIVSLPILSDKKVKKIPIEGKEK